MKFVCSLIVVRDIKVSREFYENILGQKVKYDFGENIEKRTSLPREFVEETISKR